MLTAMSGTYLINSTIEINYGMQVIGGVRITAPKGPRQSTECGGRKLIMTQQAINSPTLKSSKNFFGLGVLSTDKYWEMVSKGKTIAITNTISTQ